MPKARREQLVQEQLDGELLIYNTETHRVTCLTETAAFIWGLCDGETTLSAAEEQLRLRFGADGHPDILRATLGELESQNLLVDPAPRGTSRRAFVRAAAASVVAASVLVPRPAGAMSLLPDGAPVPGGCVGMNGFNFCQAMTCQLPQDVCGCDPMTATVCIP